MKPVLHFELPEWGYSHRGGDVLLCQSTDKRLIASNVPIPEPSQPIRGRELHAVIKVFDQGIECASLKLKMVHQSYASSAKREKRDVNAAIYTCVRGTKNDASRSNSCTPPLRRHPVRYRDSP